MTVFDSGVFDSGVFDGQPENQISGVGFVGAFGTASLQLFVLADSLGDTSGVGTAQVAAPILAEGIPPFEVPAPLMRAVVAPAGWDSSTYGAPRPAYLIYPASAADSAIGAPFTRMQITQVGLGYANEQFGAAYTWLGTLTPESIDSAAYGAALMVHVVSAAGIDDGVVGTLWTSTEWTQYLTPAGFDDAFIGLQRADLLPLPGFGSQTLNVPYFINDSYGELSHIYHRKDIQSIGDTARFGTDISWSGWKFSAGNAVSFGQAQVGTKVPFYTVINDSRLPDYNSLVYIFGQTDPPSIYCFGFRTQWGAPRVTYLVHPAGLSEQWGNTQLGIKRDTWSIESVRLSPDHLSVPISFGTSPFIYADTLSDWALGTAHLKYVAAPETISESDVGDAMVSRIAPPTLVIRDAKNTTLRYNGVPYQFGYPKFVGIFTVGIPPAGLGPDLRLPRVLNPSGVPPHSMWHWYWPELQNRNQTVKWPYSGYAWTAPGAGGFVSQPDITNLNHVGLYPRGWDSASFLGTSVYNQKLGVSPAPGVLSRFGTASVQRDELRQTMYAWGWAPYLHSVQRVWHAGPQTVGPLGGLGQLSSGYVQCVLLDPDFYHMQSFKDDDYGLATVKRAFNIRPASLDTQWGDMQVTHYTRSLGVWQPWKDTIIGGVAAIQHRYRVYAEGFVAVEQFGDAHRWEEGIIRLRPWATGALGAVRTRMEVLFHSRVHDAYVDDGRVGSPTAVHALAATTQQVDASLGDQAWLGLDVARFATGVRPVQGISIAPDGYGTAQVNRTTAVEGFASGAFSNPAALRPAVPYDIGGYFGTPSTLIPFYPYAWWDQHMDAPTVCYGTAFQCCGMIPRAMVPKGFAKEQFGDFDALV